MPARHEDVRLAALRAHATLSLVARRRQLPRLTLPIGVPLAVMPEVCLGVERALAHEPIERVVEVARRRTLLHHRRRRLAETVQQGKTWLRKASETAPLPKLSRPHPPPALRHRHRHLAILLQRQLQWRRRPRPRSRLLPAAPPSPVAPLRAPWWQNKLYLRSAGEASPPSPPPPPPSRSTYHVSSGQYGHSSWRAPFVGRRGLV